MRRVAVRFQRVGDLLRFQFKLGGESGLGLSDVSMATALILQGSNGLKLTL